MVDTKFKVVWSDDREAFVATCDEFPSLAHRGDSASEALDGLERMIHATVVASMAGKVSDECYGAALLKASGAVGVEYVDGYRVLEYLGGKTHSNLPYGDIIVRSYGEFAMTAPFADGPTRKSWLHMAHSCLYVIGYLEECRNGAAILAFSDDEDRTRRASRMAHMMLTPEPLFRKMWDEYSGDAALVSGVMRVDGNVIRRRARQLGVSPNCAHIV